MENAADALKMAGFMLIFVAALTLVMTTLSKAKSAATVIINSNDKRSNYIYLEEEQAYPVKGTNRLVGIETIIPHIFTYTEESYIIEFYNELGKPLNIVRTGRTSEKDLDGNIIGEMKNGKCYINSLGTELEANDTRTIEQKNELMNTLMSDYKDAKFIEKLDELEEETEEDDNEDDEYLQKSDEAKDTIRIISYTVQT